MPVTTTSAWSRSVIGGSAEMSAMPTANLSPSSVRNASSSVVSSLASSAGAWGANQEAGRGSSLVSVVQSPDLGLAGAERQIDRVQQHARCLSAELWSGACWCRKFGFACKPARSGMTVRVGNLACSRLLSSCLLSDDFVDRHTRVNGPLFPRFSHGVAYVASVRGEAGALALPGRRDPGTLSGRAARPVPPVDGR